MRTALFFIFFYVLVIANKILLLDGYKLSVAETWAMAASIVGVAGVLLADWWKKDGCKL